MDFIPSQDMATKSESEKITDLLREAGIRPSANRIMVMQVLSSALRPISSLEIETALDTVDHSSISRTLSAFVEAHLVHQIADGSGSMKYELCRSRHCERHDDQHIHFHCRNCGVTVCLPDSEITPVNLPEGFQAENYSYVITGLCAKCQ